MTTDQAIGQNSNGLHLREHSNRPLFYSSLMVVLWCALWCSLTLGLRWLLLRFSLPLTKEAKEKGTTRESFARDGALCLVGAGLHTFLGPAALYNSIQYDIAGPIIGLSAFSTNKIDLHDTQLDFNIMFMGEIFTGFILYQLVFWLLGWEKGIVPLLHHLGFLVAGLLVLYVTVYGKLASAAIAMELSSPWLDILLFARSLDGSTWNLITNLSSVLFALLFITVRIFVYGYATVEFHYLYWIKPDIFPRWISATLTNTILIVFTLAWVLQLFWSRQVIKKISSAIKAKPTKKA